MSLREISDQQDVCKNCGNCCKYIFRALKYTDEEHLKHMIEFHKEWGDLVHRVGKKYFTRTPLVCKHYIEGVGCDNYEGRPLVCKVFPVSFQPGMAPYCALMRQQKFEGKIDYPNR